MQPALAFSDPKCNIKTHLEIKNADISMNTHRFKPFKRLLDIKVPAGQSLFLWGPRQTGKSSFLKEQYQNSIYYDLLDTREVIRLSKAPYLLREELLAEQAHHPEKTVLPIIIDEIQKVPDLLNEVHWLIENAQMQFILCGSSARKLKSASTNLLGGRAWPFYFFPLVYPEIPNFDLLRALNQGLIPKHYLSGAQDIHDYFQAYIDVYLTEEIRNEALVRNLNSFAQFLEIVGLSHGEMINFSNIARDCGVSRTTVQGYYQILVDTLLGDFIQPFNTKLKRDLITATPKFYLFDVGVANHLGHQAITALKGSAAGKAFEHYILMELWAYHGLKRKNFEINYWRTKTGLEVDFILSQAQKPMAAIEIKISDQVHQEDLKGLIAFCEEHPNIPAFIVSQDLRPRRLQVTPTLFIDILPWRDFLEKLWDGRII